MPAACPIQKATRKTPYTKPGTVSTLNNGERLSPILHPSTMGPDAKTNEVLSPVVRCTKEQVKANNCEAALKVAEEKDSLLAHMNVQEELEAEELPVLYPQHLSTQRAKWCYMEPDSESEELECFDIRVDDVSDPDSSSKPDKEAEMKVGVIPPLLSLSINDTLKDKGTKELCLAKCNEKSQVGKSKHSIGQFMK
ncbi:hypothetical protein EI94DRAFT_1696113 [Lactarius quietus]|nr:hypothetical protein EI94DRAFT_1696113 [Lactarius quietus]